MTTPALPSKISVTSLIGRVKDTKAQLGTITDKLALNQSEAPDLPDFHQSDLTLFRYIVENGVMKSAEFRSPHGYKILDFLTMLCLMQEAERERVDREQRAEMNALFLRMTPAAQAEFKAWVKKPGHFKLTDSQTFQLFNNG